LEITWTFALRLTSYFVDIVLCAYRDGGSWECDEDSGMLDLQNPIINDGTQTIEIIRPPAASGFYHLRVVDNENAQFWARSDTFEIIFTSTSGTNWILVSYLLTVLGGLLTMCFAGYLRSLREESEGKTKLQLIRDSFDANMMSLVLPSVDVISDLMFSVEAFYGDQRLLATAAVTWFALVCVFNSWAWRRIKNDKDVDNQDR